MIFAGGAMGFALGCLFSDKNIASSLIPILVIPMMGVSGFFVRPGNVANIFLPFKYMSIFKWGTQAFVLVSRSPPE